MNVLFPLYVFSLFTNKGLPGISKDEKQIFNKGELFRYRNEMMTWYCTKDRMNKVPCQVFSQLRKTSTQEDENTTMNSTEHIFDESFGVQPHAHTTIKHYREMFTTFCNNATSENVDKICSIPLFRDRYSDTIPDMNEL